MINKKTLKYITFLIFSLPTLIFANFTITPVKVKINKDEKISAITVKNNSDQIKNFQLIMYKVVRENGQEVYKETKDLIVTPVIFKIAAGKSQLVRVAIKNNTMYSQLEDGYKIAVKELPTRISIEGAQVNLVTEFRVPISISDKHEQEEDT